jgi:phage recombination protein Bet
MSTAENMVGERPSLVKKFANKYSIDPKVLMATLKQTCFRQSEGEVSDEQMVALLVVADQYSLNPFTKEIYAYPDKYKGIVPVVSIDGWVRIVTEHPDYNGYDVILPAVMMQPAQLLEHPPCWEWITIKMHRKRVEHTPALTEYFDECYKPPYKPRGKDYFIDSPWQTHPKRFLRHKAFIQAGRVVFGFAGIYDDDEAQRIVEAGGRAEPVATQGTRTEQAKANLQRSLTDQAGTGGLEAGVDNQAEALRVETRKREKMAADVMNKEFGGGAPDREQRTFEESQRTVNQQQKQPEPEKKQGPGYKYGLAEALAELRKQTTTAGLKKAYDAICDDWDFSGRGDVPLDVEAIMRDIKEDLQEREAIQAENKHE